MNPKRYEIAAKALALNEDGEPLYTIREIANSYNCSPSTVIKYRDQYQETEEIEDRRKYNGSKPALTDREQRLVGRIFSKSNNTSLREASTQLKEDNDINISPSTVKTYLNKSKIKAYRTSTKPALDSSMKKKRYNFALIYMNKSANWWRRVRFSDEAYFKMDELGYRSIIWRRKTSRMQSKKANKKTKYPPKLMVWGWIDYQGTGNLVWIRDNMKAADYIELLDRNLPCDRNFIFLQDGASVHTAGDVFDFFYDNNVEFIEDFPPQSPDLNPIEHVWAFVKRSLKGRSARNLQELWRIIQDIWENISIDFIHSLIDSMPRRLEAVKKARGSHTQY